MVGQVIAVVQVKGGVGKSTLAAHLVGWLHKQGKTVAVVDSDPQQAVSRWLSEALPDVETITALRSDDVIEAVPELAERFGFVICDGPGGEDEATRALMLRADLALLPCGPSALDLRALKETAHLVKQARSIRGGLPDAVVVLNRQQPRTLVSQDVAAEAPALGLRVAGTVIRQRAATADSAGQGTFVWDLAVSGARDAAVEIQTLFGEVFTDGSQEEASPTVLEGTGVHRADDDEGREREAEQQ